MYHQALPVALAPTGGLRALQSLGRSCHPLVTDPPELLSSEQRPQHGRMLDGGHTIRRVVDPGQLSCTPRMPFTGCFDRQLAQGEQVDPAGDCASQVIDRAQLRQSSFHRLHGNLIRPVVEYPVSPEASLLAIEVDDEQPLARHGREAQKSTLQCATMQELNDRSRRRLEWSVLTRRAQQVAHPLARLRVQGVSGDIANKLTFPAGHGRPPGLR